MDFKQLEAFAYVINLGSFSRAAEKLFLTQPTISAHISSLEKELGAQLIIRTPKMAYASETGNILYEYASDMLLARENAIAACKKQQAEMRGFISIAASTIPYQHVLPRLMREFRMLNPGVTFSVLSCDSGNVVSNILTGKAEIGMAGSIMDTSKCVYDSFMEDSLVVITPGVGPYSRIANSSFKLEDLAKYPFIIREPGSGTRKETEEYLVKRGLSLDSLDVVAQMDNPDAIKNSVGQGLGISIVSQLSVSDYESYGMLRAFRLEGEPISRKLYLVRRSNRLVSPMAAAFIKYVMNLHSLTCI